MRLGAQLHSAMGPRRAAPRGQARAAAAGPVPAATAAAAAASAAAAAAAAAAAGEAAAAARKRQAAAPAEPAEGAAPAAATPTKKRPKLKEPSVDVQDAVLMEKAARLLAQLSQLYPSPAIPLSHGSDFQLLVAVLLSAQSTDAKVNTVTPQLFQRWPTPQAMSGAQVADVEGAIRVLGLAPTKARNIVALSKIIVEQHSGAVPQTFEGLEALPGVGHKTASVVMSQAFGFPAFPVDTHIHRLAQRWGLTLEGGSVEQTEADLKALFPQHTWHNAHLQIIYAGREHCPAVGHDPTACAICSWAAVPPYDQPGFSPARPGKPRQGQSPKKGQKKARK